MRIKYNGQNCVLFEWMRAADQKPVYNLEWPKKAFACLSSPSRARYHVSRQIHVLRVGAVLLILHLSIFKYV